MSGYANLRSEAQGFISDHLLGPEELCSYAPDGEFAEFHRGARIMQALLDLLPRVDVDADSSILGLPVYVDPHMPTDVVAVVPTGLGYTMDARGGVHSSADRLRYQCIECLDWFATKAECATHVHAGHDARTGDPIVDGS